MAQSLPFLGSDTCEQCSVQSVQHIEICDGSATAALFRAAKVESRTGLRRTRRSNNDWPWELVRAKNDSRRRGCGRFGGRLREGMSWDGRLCCAIDDCSGGRGVQNVVRNGCTMETSGGEERVHMKKIGGMLSAGVEIQRGMAGRMTTSRLNVLICVI